MAGKGGKGIGKTGTKGTGKRHSTKKPSRSSI